MQEFFAAVHAVRECNRTPKKKSISDLVVELGVDGDYARFWPFVSGLLSGQLCESLLIAIAEKVAAARDGDRPKLSRLLLLLLHCHSECVTELPREGSPAVTVVMMSIGLQLRFTHVSVSDARAVADVLRKYSSAVEKVDLFSTIMDDSSASIVIAGLQNCTRLTLLHPGMTSNEADSQAITKVIEQNKSSLRILVVPAGDEGLPLITPSITACTELVSLTVGSRALTNTSAPDVADILRCHRSLKVFGLTGEIDDNGFTSIVSSLLDTPGQLQRLVLHWTVLSVPMLSGTLTALTCLEWLKLVGNPIGDDGFQQLTIPLRQLTSLQTLELIDVDLTIQSVEEMEKLLQSKPSLGKILVLNKKGAFFPLGQDVDDITQLTSMSMQEKIRRGEPSFQLGYSITEQLVFVNDRSQRLLIGFFP